MSNVVNLPLLTAAPASAQHLPRLALLGTGTVGTAFVQRYQRLQERIALPTLALIANSRITLECNAGTIRETLDSARTAPSPFVDEEAPNFALPPPFSKGGDDAALRPGDIVIDATASEHIAATHAHWLARGVHVVTANKLGSGADLLRAQAIARAQRDGGARYGDAATVGAGLPLLRSIRELVAGGDRIHAIEGVLSGSLAWLFDHYDGMRPFSGFVREARDAGYTEPDPRIDLSGEDVRRKLLILARAAGLAMEAHEVRVESLVPDALAGAADSQVDAQLALLDAPLRERFKAARRDGGCLRFVGRIGISTDAGCDASVGLVALPAAHALCSGNGTDNLVAIASDRYDTQPLVIRGPGAGAGVTAAALIDDVLRVAAAR